MSKRVMRAQQAFLVRYRGEVFVKHLLAVNDRTDLQEVELSCSVVVQSAGKFNLYRSLHAVGTMSH